MDARVTNKVATLPNLITLIRLLLVPVFAVVLVGLENNILAFILFLIAASTDFLDGAVARATNQVSRLGQQLDPLVDRALILTAVVFVFAIGRVPLWILILLIARDVFMAVLLVRLRSSGQMQFKVAFVGKAATAVNMMGFCLLILNWPVVGGEDNPTLLGVWFLYVGVALAWAAGIYYLLRSLKALRFADPPSGARSQAEDRRRTAGRAGDFGNTRTARGQERAQGEEFRNGGPADRRQRPGGSPMAAATAGSAASVGWRHEDDFWNAKESGQAGGVRRRMPQNDRQAQHAPRGTAGGNQNIRANKSPQKKRGGIAGVLRVLNTPRKMLIAIAVLLLLVVGVVFYGCDGISNFGVIHQGVRVGTVDVSRMQQDEAAALISKELNAQAAQTPVSLFASEAAAQAGENSNTVQMGNGVTETTTEINTNATSWSITPATLNAEASGAQLAQDAYGVGRGGDFILGRLAASVFGVTLEPQLVLTEDRLNHLESVLTESIGTPMRNASMSFDGTSFIAEDGQDGFEVDSEPFQRMLQQAFFSDDRGVVVPMVDRPMQVKLDAVKEIAQTTQQAISRPVTLTYDESSWELSTAQLGTIISTEVVQNESGTWELVPTVNVALLQALLAGIVGTVEDQIAPINAEFAVVDGALQIVPGQNGTGIDYRRLAEDLNALLFGAETSPEDATNGADGASTSGDAQNRVVPMQIGVLEPEVQASDLEAYDFSTKIHEYTLEYPYVPAATVTNIHVAADHCNSSLIAPQAIWSLIGSVGEFTAENGFVDSQIIVGDEYVDGMGGGTCTVASTIYNAVYEVGYPIVERVNHSLRALRYPLGRDAAIAYPYADLKFQNDTENYLLLTMTYTDTTVTCILWGTPPGYTVESITGELIEGADFEKKEVVDESLAPGERYVDQEGLKASKVEVTRIVYYADGTEKERRVFYSSYDATNEITLVGPSS